MQEYQVVKAKTTIEAIAQSDWGVGDAAICDEVRAVGNSDGTFSIFASFKKPEEEPIHSFKNKIPKTCLNRP